MSADLPVDFYQLRVLIERDDDYKVIVARCLETGSIATADDVPTVRGMMLEILLDEIDYNADGPGNLSNLFSNPAPIEIWRQYYEASKNHNAENVDGVLMIDITTNPNATAGEVREG